MNTKHHRDAGRPGSNLEISGGRVDLGDLVEWLRSLWGKADLEAFDQRDFVAKQLIMAVSTAIASGVQTEDECVTYLKNEFDPDKLSVFPKIWKTLEKGIRFLYKEQSKLLEETIEQLSQDLEV